jgi:hypothetical protein
MGKGRGSGFVRTAAAPGSSINAQFREGRAALRRAERKALEREADDVKKQERDLAARKEALRVKELEAQGRGILSRGQRG